MDWDDGKKSLLMDELNDRTEDTAIHHEQCSTTTRIDLSNRSSSDQVLGNPTMSLWQADWLFEWQYLDLSSAQDILVIRSGCSHDCRNASILIFQDMVQLGLASSCHAHKDHSYSGGQVT